MIAVIEALYGVLDRSPVAIILMDGHRRVVFANAHAAELHARADGVSICGNGVALARAHDHARLQALIASAFGVHAPARSMRALRSSGKRAYGVLVAPLSQCEPEHVGIAIRPLVCIVIADPEKPHTLQVARLRQSFDLTEAESRLAARLAAGEGLRSAACSLGITYGTARARLAEIFQKTDTRRQGELVNLLLTTLP